MLADLDGGGVKAWWRIRKNRLRHVPSETLTYVAVDRTDGGWWSLGFVL